MPQPTTAASTVTYRPLCPDDYGELRALHLDLFPINYADDFFHKATLGLEGIFSWAAIARDVAGAAGGGLVGFVTVREVALGEADPADRARMGLAARAADGQAAAYILTLGVAPAWRQAGIARALVARAVQQAAQRRCRAVYLHVIAYNAVAIAFYHAAGFAAGGLLRDFYTITTGRQPDPAVSRYDAYLYWLPLDGGPTPAAAPPLPALLLGAAAAPLRSAWGRAAACLAWACAPAPPLHRALPASLSAGGPQAGLPGAAPPPPPPSWLLRLFSRS